MLNVPSLKSLTFKPREDLAKSVYRSKLLESTFVEIECRKKANIIVGCLYKHPVMSKGDFNDNFLANLLERINREGKRLILLGFVDILQSRTIF